ncbi:MAG: hypothetical protein QCI00_06630 [Candidatus Thermoplasmatota archaeon]|nr:hypothetical protein [Candidatus Thermoplasmatota archaeon]
MAGYQDFVNLFGSGLFIRSEKIKKRYSFEKALSSLYIIPSFYKGLYYIPTKRERKGHFIEHKQDFFISLFNQQYGRGNWYWALSTAARYYGFEWSATGILEVMTKKRSKTIDIACRIESLKQKQSYRSFTLADYYESLQVNVIYVHKGDESNVSSIRIDGEIGPVCTKDQLITDLGTYVSKVKHQRLKRIYKRIMDEIEE